MSTERDERDERVRQIREAASLIRVWMYRNDFDAERCAQEVFDLFKRQCPERFFWVLERFENGQSAGYWNGMNSRSFVTNIDAAIQFRRREDAIPIKSSWHWQDVQITEHGYVASESPAVAPDAATRMRDRCVGKVKQMRDELQEGAGWAWGTKVGTANKIITALQSLTLEGEQEKHGNDA